MSGVGVPATNLVPPAPPLVSSTPSPNIQRITSLQDTVPDGRVGELLVSVIIIALYEEKFKL